MAKKINFHLEKYEFMIPITKINNHGEKKETNALEQRLYTTEDFESEDET